MSETLAEPRSRRLYLHPQTGWTENPEGAVIRLDAYLSVRQLAESRNLVRVPDGRGGWTVPHDETKLSPVQRGLVWSGWRTMAGGKEYLAFKGVRVVDDEVAKLLDGLTVRAETGARLDNPQSAGHLFLLSVDDAAVFHKRVKDAGGEVLRGTPVPEDVTAAMRTLKQCAEQMRALSEQDEAVLDEARSGDFSGQASFERRHGQYAALMQRARDVHEEGTRALRSLGAPGRSADDQARALSLDVQLSADMGACVTAYEQREGLERELARELAMAQGKLTVVASPAQRLLMFRELGRVAREEGLQVEDTADGVRVQTEFGWLQLGPGFRFEA